MPEGVSNSLVNLGDLAKPADTLIKKVSKGIDGIFLPFQTVRLAKADAKAALIKAQSEVEVTDIQRRAIRRWLNEEEQKQQNIEDITRKSFQYLHDDTDAGIAKRFDEYINNVVPALNYFKGKENYAKEIIEMVENYLSDAKHFQTKGDFVNAFAALNYAHGWLDSGVRLDIFNVKDDKLFTIK